jgi:hypothetical protein
MGLRLDQLGQREDVRVLESQVAEEQNEKVRPLQPLAAESRWLTTRALHLGDKK